MLCTIAPMAPVVFMVVAFCSAIGAGLLGSLLGLGGGIIVVPVLTLLLGVEIHYAIGASLIAVIATSSGAGSSYVRQHIANVRLAMFMELATTGGAILGAFAAGMISAKWLYMLFGLLMVFTAYLMLRHNEGKERPVLPDALADKLKLHGAFHDHATGKDVQYRVCRSRAGFAVSGIAGIISGLLGVGGGIIKVPMMTLAMNVPIKAATATSNFIIGATAAASAGVYFARGDVNPSIAGPVAMGVLVGAMTGSKLQKRIKSGTIRRAFSIVVVIVAVQMLLKGVRS